MKIMKYIVYCTTNLINNKIYIGVHGTENPEIFDGYIGNSINIYKVNPELHNPKLAFHKAIKKYGFNAFKREIIEIFDTIEEAQYTKDGKLIKIFNSTKEARKIFPNVGKVLRG